MFLHDQCNIFLIIVANQSRLKIACQMQEYRLRPLSPYQHPWNIVIIPFLQFCEKKCPTDRKLTIVYKPTLQEIFLMALYVAVLWHAFHFIPSILGVVIYWAITIYIVILVLQIPYITMTLMLLR